MSKNMQNALNAYDFKTYVAKNLQRILLTFGVILPIMMVEK